MWYLHSQNTLSFNNLLIKVKKTIYWWNSKKTLNCITISKKFPLKYKMVKYIKETNLWFIV